MPIEQIGANEAIARTQFEALLRDWYSRTTEDRIGDAEFGRTAWIHVQEGSLVYRLNADTKRKGVTEYLRLLDEQGDGLEWSVVTNQRVRDNAVAFGHDYRRIPRFYLYLCDSR